MRNANLQCARHTPIALVETQEKARTGDARPRYGLLGVLRHPVDEAAATQDDFVESWRNRQCHR